MDDVEIRPAQSDDAVPLAALAVEVWLETYATQGVSRADATHVFAELNPAAMRAVLADPHRAVHVAARPRHLLAFSQIRLDARHAMVAARAPAELERIYVQARFCGRGLGARLLAASERFAASRGADAVWLTAWSENERALAFYARHGWTDIGETRFEYQGEVVANRLLVKRP